MEWLFFDKVGAAFQPDLVLMVAFVGNDAIEAVDAMPSFEAGRPIAATEPSVRRIRRLVRSSIVLQSVRVRWDQLRSRIALGTPEAPLASYLASPPPVVQQGMDASQRVFGRIAARATEIGAKTAIALMPARFQVNDEDFGNLSAIVKKAGGELDRNASSRRFQQALAPLGLPMIDLQPVLFAQPNRAGISFSARCISRLAATTWSRKRCSSFCRAASWSASARSSVAPSGTAAPIRAGPPCRRSTIHAVDGEEFELLGGLNREHQRLPEERVVHAQSVAARRDLEGDGLAIEQRDTGSVVQPREHLLVAGNRWDAFD